MFTIYPINNPVAFMIFNFPVRWYGVALASSIFLGIFLGNYFILKKYSKFESDIFIDSIFPVVLSSIVGARLFYVLDEYEFYFKNPREIIMINHGGLSIFGAILFGILTLFFYLKFKKVAILKYFDIFALVMPLCQSIGRYGNYFNQEAFGLPTNGFLRLFVDEAYRPEEFLNFSFFHPTFLYESILNFLLFFVLLFIFFKTKKYRTGLIFSLYLIFYSLIRLFVESIRVDSIFNLGFLPVASFLSIVTLFFGVIILIYIKKHPV